MKMSSSSVDSELKLIAKDLIRETSSPNDIIQLRKYLSVRDEGCVECATRVRIFAALCDPMLVMNEAEYVGLWPIGPRVC